MEDTVGKLVLPVQEVLESPVFVLLPLVIEENSSRKSSLPPAPPEETVIASILESVPAEFVAEIVTIEVPDVLGVPEMSPVELFTLRPDGKPVAPKEVGVLFALIV